MNSTQIPLLPNWDTHDKNEWANVAYSLSISSPYHVKDEKGALSGVDCMVRVIQHLLRCLPCELSQRLIRKHRKHNFLVDLAIRNFKRNTPTQRQDMQVARDIVWRGLCGQKLSANGTPTFLEIDKGRLMQSTLWQEHDFQAFHESLVKPFAAESFQTLRTLEEYPSDLDELRTSNSLFFWDTSLHDGFEDMFKEHFRRTHVDGLHGTYTLFSKESRIARVLLDPTKAELKGPGIAHLRRMPMATRRQTRQRCQGGTSGSTVTYSAEDVYVTYSLVAVVRLRNSPHDHDYVRLYDRNGHPVVPTVPAEECKSYHSDDWSISDQDHQYMLYYVGPYVLVPGQRTFGPSSDIEGLTHEPHPRWAPSVSKRASEVVRPGKSPHHQMSTQGLAGGRAAIIRPGRERRLEERKQAENQARQQQAAPQGQEGTEKKEPATGTGEQPASSGTQLSSSQRPGSISLPSHTVPPSSATMPSSSGHQPVLTASTTGKASPVVQGKSLVLPEESPSPTVPPSVHEHAKSQPSSPGAHNVAARSGITGKRPAADDDEGNGSPSRESESHEPGREPKKTSASAPKRKKRRQKEPMPTYSSSFEEQEREKAKQAEQND